MTRRAVLRMLRWSRGVALGLIAALGVSTAFAACGTRPNAVGPGGECFLATDCAPGLVCIEQKNRSRICSDDLSSVAGESPPEAGAAKEDAGGRDGAVIEASGPDDTGTPTTADTGPPDTGAPVPDPPEAGGLEDSGGP